MSRYTKHYFNGAERLASKIGVGTLDNSEAKGYYQAGGIDYGKRYTDAYKDFKQIAKDNQLPPGPPNIKYIYAQEFMAGLQNTETVTDLTLLNNLSLAEWQNLNSDKDPGPPVCEPPFCDTGGNIDSPTLPENEVYFFHPDHLGNTSYITNIVGETVQFNSYLPFGETFVSQKRTSTISQYTFLSKEKDLETGLHHLSARYYSSDLSVFLTIDPLWEETGDPYGYAYRNPIKLIDPSGLGPETYIVDKESGDSTFINDGSNDIVVLNSDDYNKAKEIGSSLYDNYVELTGSFLENLNKIDEYNETLSRGEKHTIDNFSTGDNRLDQNILSLDPRVRTKMILTSLQARIKGIDVRGAGLGGHRTYDEQNKLYAQGRTTPGSIVTNARGGRSNHNFGLSMDVAIFENGKYLRNGTEPQYKQFGLIAESNGLQWGGRWKSPFDPAHVEYKHGYKMSELRALPKDSNGYIKAPIVK